MRILRLTALIVALGMFMAVPQLTNAANSYTAYVACGWKTDRPPATKCAKSGRIGAFFKSNDADVRFKTCVTFPNGQDICTRKATAKAGQFYVSHVTVGSKGKLKVQWKVGGVVVASYKIKVT